MLRYPTPDLLARLRDIVTPAGMLTDPSDLEPFLTDHRQLFRGATPCVLQPNSSAQVAAILALCHAEHVGVVPVGGNTSYCGGATPSADGSQLVLSLARLKQIRHIDPNNYTITVEAGCRLTEIQSAAEQVQRLFPLSLGSEGSCQIGGNLATNAGGTAVLRYGMTRDLVLGLEVVLPDGRVLDELTGLRKNNTGYDLKQLFIGAEGTLGVITAATLKLFPLPPQRVTALVGLPSPEAAVQLLAHLRTQAGDNLTTFELMPRTALQLVLDHIPHTRDPFDAAHAWYVLLEASSFEVGSHDARINLALTQALTEVLTQTTDTALVNDVVMAQNAAQREQFWQLREAIPEAQRRASVSIKHDISVAISALPALIAEGSARCRDIAPEALQVIYGHLGDGSLHFNINAPIGGDAAAFLAKKSQIHRAIHDLVQRYRGSISAEHGIGQLKVAELAHYKDPVALDVMRSIKHALDPHGIMNPGKVLGN